LDQSVPKKLKQVNQVIIGFTFCIYACTEFNI